MVIDPKTILPQQHPYVQLNNVIEEVFGILTLEQAVARLDAAGIANAHTKSVQRFWEHPQHAAPPRAHSLHRAGVLGFPDFPRARPLRPRSAPTPACVRGPS